MSGPTLKESIETGEAIARLLERDGFDATRFDKESAERLHETLSTLITHARQIAAPRCYITSEKHLSGARVTVGFGTLAEAADFHEALAKQALR